jgi:hypothetical protein
MRQNAYTFRRPGYERNTTPVLNKKISLPPAYREYTPVLTFRNNFSTPAMSGMRGLQTMPGLNITPDVANDAYVSFKFNVPIISDIKAAEIARREVKTTSMIVTVSMLNNLPSIQLVAIANQLLNLPASPAKNSFISVVYKLLKDMVSIPGPPLADRLAMQDALNKLETVQPAVLIPPAVILPGGAVGVIVPPGALPGGVPPGGVPGGVPPGGVPGGVPGGAPGGVPGGVPPGAPTPTQEINDDIINLFQTGNFTRGELDDIENKINALTDPVEQKEYKFLFKEVNDSINIIDDINALTANTYKDPAVQKIEADIKNLTTQTFRDNLNLGLTQKMTSLGVNPPSGAPSGPPITPGGPPAGVPGELYYKLVELKDLKDKKDPDYKDFIDSIDAKGLYYDTPSDKKGRSPSSPDRPDYVARWIDPANRNKTSTEYIASLNQRLSKLKPTSRPDPDGIYSNKRGFIHNSIR